MNDPASAAALPKDWIEISDPARLPDQPVVSVLMLTYNHAPYLAEAIDGVLMQQTDFPIELLIGEDCSTDDTREIALRYQREHPGLIRVITANRNIGMHENFRRIFRASRGEFVALCEGDDYWIEPGKLQNQVDLLRARRDVTAVYTNFATSDLMDGSWSVDVADTAFANADLDDLRGDLRGKPLEAGKLRTLTSVLRSSVIETLYAKNLPMDAYPFVDAFLLAQAVGSGNIECIDWVSAVYRRSPSSATRSGLSSILRFTQAMRKLHSNFGILFPELTPLSASALHDMDMGICRVAYMAGDPEAYEEAYRRLQASELPIPAHLVILRWVVKCQRFRRISVVLRATLKRFVRGIQSGSRQPR